MEKNRKIANEILYVLMYTNPTIYLTWGVTKLYLIENGLRIRVKGLRHKGYVDIILDEGSDTYIVKIVTLKGVVKETIEDVYFDNLQSVIDDRIERIKQYKV